MGQPAWSNIQTLTGYKKSLFSPKVLNSNHRRPEWSTEGFPLSQGLMVRCPRAGRKSKARRPDGNEGSSALPSSDSFTPPTAQPASQTHSPSGSAPLSLPRQMMPEQANIYMQEKMNFNPYLTFYTFPLKKPQNGSQTYYNSKL